MTPPSKHEHELAEDIAASWRSYRSGQQEPLDGAVALVYGELRAIAHRMLRRMSGVSLGPTEAVHEVYLKLVGQRNTEWQSRGHFLAIATVAMRRVLVDYARAQGRDKRGGNLKRVTLSGVLPSLVAPVDVLEIEALLCDLERLDARDAEIVCYRVYGGMTVPEVAATLGVSTSTVEKRWRAARAWLLHQLADRPRD